VQSEAQMQAKDRPMRKCKLACYVKEEFHQKATPQQLKEAFEASGVPLEARPRELYVYTTRSDEELVALKKKVDFYLEFEPKKEEEKKLISKCIHRITNILQSDLNSLKICDRKKQVNFDLDWKMFSEKSINKIEKILDDIEPKINTKQVNTKNRTKKKRTKRKVVEIDQVEMNHFVSTLENFDDEPIIISQEQQQKMNDFVFTQEEAEMILNEGSLICDALSGWL